MTSRAPTDLGPSFPAVRWAMAGRDSFGRPKRTRAGRQRAQLLPEAS